MAFPENLLRGKGLGWHDRFVFHQLRFLGEPVDLAFGGVWWHLVIFLVNVGQDSLPRIIKLIDSREVKDIDEYSMCSSVLRFVV